MAEGMTRAQAFDMVLLERGVEPGEHCLECCGLGRRTYPNTATWHGGIGGQVATMDVCCTCWGTGDRHVRGADLKAMYETIAALRTRNTASIRSLTAEARRIKTMLVTGVLDDRYRPPPGDRKRARSSKKC